MIFELIPKENYNNNISHYTLISLLVFCFYIETKELCEARVKPEMSSNLAEEPSLADVLPPHKTAGEKSELFLIYTVNENPFETVNL